jgi:hypothetical protein
VILEFELSECSGVFIETIVTNFIKGTVDHARVFTGIPVNLDKKAMVLNCPDVLFVSRKEKS